MTLSVHDNNVYAYVADCKGRRLTLYSRFNDSHRNEFTDIIFSGVLAHKLDYVLEGNILFDIEEFHVTQLVDEDAELFRASWRHGWPPVEYGGDMDRLKIELAKTSVRAYRISSSYGISGWVLAMNCELVPAASPYGSTNDS